jgi:phosphatidylserine/phosphatidylglycerophosphate/cardiolipin synthase-like enzyme
MHTQYLSSLLERQRQDNGADVRLLTKAPDDEPTTPTKKRKFSLLTKLEQAGVTVEINDRLHAKVFLFRRRGLPADATLRIGDCWVVGSANLTRPGFEEHLELSLQGWLAHDWDAIRRRVGSYFSHRDTITFAQWRALNKNFVVLMQRA